MIGLSPIFVLNLAEVTVSVLISTFRHNLHSSAYSLQYSVRISRGMKIQLVMIALGMKRMILKVGVLVNNISTIRIIDMYLPMKKNEWKGVRLTVIKTVH